MNIYSGVQVDAQFDAVTVSGYFKERVNLIVVSCVALAIAVPVVVPKAVSLTGVFGSFIDDIVKVAFSNPIIAFG